MDIISIQPVSILITIANIIILYLILRHFLRKPVNAVLEKRKALLEEEKNRAEQINEEANEYKKQYEAKVAELKANEKETMAESARKAAKEYDRILLDATTRADEIIADANKKAEMDAKNRQAEKDRELADIVAEAAKKIAAASSNAQVDRSLYDEFLNKAGEDDLE